MQGTQYATKRSILCRGAFCGPTEHEHCDQPGYLIHTILFMHKLLVECQGFHTGHFIQSRLFGKNRKISIL